MNRGGLKYPKQEFFTSLKLMNHLFEKYHPNKRLKKGPGVVKNFAKAMAPFFSIPYAVTYDFDILLMFATIRTAIRVREWNRENSKYKKMTLRGQTKNAEYIQSTQGEGRQTRARAAALFPDEKFPEPMSDHDLLAFLTEPEPDHLIEMSEQLSEEWIDLDDESEMIFNDPPLPGPSLPKKSSKVPTRRQPARKTKK